jgi:hypothetical protein
MSTSAREKRVRLAKQTLRRTRGDDYFVLEIPPASRAGSQGSIVCPSGAPSRTLEGVGRRLLPPAHARSTLIADRDW